MKEALAQKDEAGRVWADAKWGCYAFYDYDGEPIYVGQTVESLRVRIRRHLSNQRTDAVAMRILDVFEVAQLEMWPLWDFEVESTRSARAKKHLDAVEYSAYLKAIEESRFKAILNEKIPPVSNAVPLPPSLKVDLISDENREERGHPDIRIARRAETVSRLADVAHERGEVSIGLRRVLVIQSVRLTYLTAERFAMAAKLPPPQESAIDAVSLLGGKKQVEEPGADQNDEPSSADELNETDEVEVGGDGQLPLE